MASSQPKYGGVIAPSSSSATVLDTLAGAITAEIRLLEDLVGIMRRQRAAVSDDDLQGVDDSVFAIHRVLVTLGEARRHRRALGELIGSAEDTSLRDLEEILGDQVTPALRFARDGLRTVAMTLSQEVELNRQVLREALSAGDGYVKTLYGLTEVPRTYNANVRQPEAETSGGVFINRRA